MMDLASILVFSVMAILTLISFGVVVAIVLLEWNPGKFAAPVTSELRPSNRGKLTSQRPSRSPGGTPWKSPMPSHTRGLSMRPNVSSRCPRSKVATRTFPSAFM
jgi:hypothetical protein